MSSHLRQLVNLISSAVEQIDAAYSKKGIVFPSLDEVVTPGTLAETLALSPEIVGAAMLVVAACGQLAANVRPAPLTLVEMGLQHEVPACLNVVLTTNTVEILREAGPPGLHVKDISKQNGSDALQLSRVLRLLATHHVFREVAPDVFANNRLSSVLDTGKSVDDLKAKPADRHIGAHGIASVVEHHSDECLKGIAYYSDVFIGGDSSEPDQTAFAKAFGNLGKMDAWAWLEQPENKNRLTRFGCAMEATTKFDRPDAILHGFDFGKLPQDALLVDVAGGIGSSSLIIFKAAPHLKVLVQDRAPVIKQGIEFWRSSAPDAISSQRVQLQAHDIFSAQPIKNADVFMLRAILHDWSDKYATKILGRLRAAAQPTTRLVVIDQILSYACVDTSAASALPGSAAGPPAPAPLLPNMGRANTMPYLIDVLMNMFLNGQERTLAHFVELLADSGWKAVHVYRIPGSFISQIECIPI